MYKEYKVEVIEEGACGTIFLGSARMPVRLEAKLNEAAAELAPSLSNVDFGCSGPKRPLSSHEAAQPRTTNDQSLPTNDVGLLHEHKTGSTASTSSSHSAIAPTRFRTHYRNDLDYYF